MCAFMYLYPENLPAGSMPKTKGVPYSWEISQPDGNDEGTDISKYSSLGAPAMLLLLLLLGGQHLELLIFKTDSKGLY